MKTTDLLNMRLECYITRPPTFNGDKIQLGGTTKIDGDATTLNDTEVSNDISPRKCLGS